MPRPVATERRSVLLDAALDVVVQQGLRGLTHRAVDREAAVAEGTTSAYFRTRRALHHALGERVTHRLADDVDRVVGDIGDADPGRPEALACVVDLFTGWLDESPLLQAKVELTLESTRDAELAAVLARERERVVGLVASVLEARGSTTAWPRASVVVAAFDGILLAALTSAPEERDQFVADAVRFTLQPLSHEDT
ncbi:TetR/AcrR family transcriptional regulator [Nocardioides dongxiaopingii]|uniref:TetR/AcrR family transcriptional regulator n=1 Tax=Nocardioides TaxID=1839 RepID=UPI001BAF9F09|nr:MULTISPECIES: TetR family transcriptional regulator [Nocardioides]